jgi:hypothetical protein
MTKLKLTLLLSLIITSSVYLARHLRHDGYYSNDPNPSYDVRQSEEFLHNQQELAQRQLNN